MRDLDSELVWNKVKIIGKDKPFQCATANGITIINFDLCILSRNKIILNDIEL